MNATDPLERLRAANPVPDPTPEEAAADALLARVLATPREERRTIVRRGRPRLVLPAAVAAAAAAALLAVALGGGDSLVERAYAAVQPGGDVIHEVVVSEWSTEGGAGANGGETIDAWYHPAGGRARRHVSGSEGLYDVVVAPGGVRVRSPNTGRRWAENDDPAFRARNRTDFLHEFRRAYESGQLKELGPRTFEGRDAVAYRVRNPRGIDSLTWYVDVATAMPLGSIELLSHREKAGEPLRTQTHVRRLERYERLPATPENLSRLETGPER
jgi:hypothetical protein